MKKICSRCKIEKEENEFPMNGKKRHSWCKLCHREVVREKYYANRDFVNSLKTKCSRCGYDKNKAALEWHHPDNNKEFNINSLAKNAITNKERILNEISKCTLLCANCHREEHYPQLNKKS